MVFIDNVNELRHRLVKYKDYKLKNYANSSEYDSHRQDQNINNKLILSNKIKKYLLNKYGTLTNLDNYGYEDIQLFIEFMKFQGYDTNFIERIYKIQKSRINWNNIPKTDEKFWTNINWKKFWNGEYN